MAKMSTVAKANYTTIEVAGREVQLSNPGKVFFPKPGFTKLDLAEYYIAVEEAAVNQLRERPGTMKRFVDGDHRRVLLPEAGAEGRARLAADGHLHLPERAHRDRARRQRRGASRLGGQPRGGRLQPASCPPQRPRPSRRASGRPRPDARGPLEHGPQGRRCVVKDVLEEHGLVGYPKTSGSRGIHVNVRIEPRWDYVEVRRAALALAREVERRLPRNATSKWWKEERHGVFVDYNQNARDRTIASGYSVRPVPDARSAARSTGTRCRTSTPASYGSTPSRTGSGRRATRRRTSTATPDRSTGCSTSPAATRRAASATPLAAALRRSSAASPSGCSRAGRRRGSRVPKTGDEGELTGANQGSVLLSGRHGTQGQDSRAEESPGIASCAHGVVTRQELQRAGLSNAELKCRDRTGPDSYSSRRFPCGPPGHRASKPAISQQSRHAVTGRPCLPAWPPRTCFGLLEAPAFIARSSCADPTPDHGSG